MCLFDLKMGRMEISNAIQLSYSYISVTPYTCNPRTSCLLPQYPLLHTVSGVPWRKAMYSSLFINFVWSRSYDSGGVVCVMTHHGDGGEQTVVLVWNTAYMPRIIFDWRDGLITSGRIHYLFTNVCNYVATLISTLRVRKTERVTRRVIHTIVCQIGRVVPVGWVGLGRPGGSSRCLQIRPTWNIWWWRQQP